MSDKPHKVHTSKGPHRPVLDLAKIDRELHEELVRLARKTEAKAVWDGTAPADKKHVLFADSDLIRKLLPYFGYDKEGQMIEVKMPPHDRRLEVGVFVGTGLKSFLEGKMPSQPSWTDFIVNPDGSHTLPRVTDGAGLYMMLHWRH